jgi:putative holliday junction resolvase
MSESSMSKVQGRVLGIDIGKERIGLALSDPQRLIAQAWQTLYVKKRSLNKIAIEIVELCEQETIKTLVFGWPLRLNGKEGIQTRHVQRLIDRITPLSDLEIYRWDERLSTVAAERVLIEGSVGRKQRKAVVDQVAACLILQAWLDQAIHQH